jgi:hypothetical protein
MTHDLLCPYIEDTDGVIYAWNECECDLISAVRQDQTKILNSRVMYQTGYTDALVMVKQYALSLLNTELHLINEEIVIESIVGYIDDKLKEG